MPTVREIIREDRDKELKTGKAPGASDFLCRAIVALREIGVIPVDAPVNDTPVRLMLGATEIPFAEVANLVFAATRATVHQQDVVDAAREQFANTPEVSGALAKIADLRRRLEIIEEQIEEETIAVFGEVGEP